MPAYDVSAGHKVIALVQGFASYLYGGWPLITANTRFLITSVQATLTAATITGAVVEGNIPVVGALITVAQVQSNSGLFQIKGAAITAVSINATTGIGTISYTYTGTTFGPDSSPAAAGLATIVQPETSETNAIGFSIPCTMPVQDPKTDSARTVSVVIAFPSLPTTCTVFLQWAISDQNSEYENFSSTPIATVSGGAVTTGPGAQYSLNMARFYRLNVATLTGGPGTIIGKILV